MVLFSCWYGGGIHVWKIYHLPRNLGLWRARAVYLAPATDYPYRERVPDRSPKPSLRRPLDMSPKLYWTVTGLLAAGLAFAGVGNVLVLPEVYATVQPLGYPAYVLHILGVGKLLAAVAIVVPGRPILKEWAYAGVVFIMVGAIASHFFMGEPAAKSAPATFFLALTLVSWASRPADRRVTLAR